MKGISIQIYVDRSNIQTMVIAAWNCRADGCDSMLEIYGARHQREVVGGGKTNQRPMWRSVLTRFQQFSRIAMQWVKPLLWFSTGKYAENLFCRRTIPAINNLQRMIHDGSHLGSRCKGEFVFAGHWMQSRSFLCMVGSRMVLVFKTWKSYEEDISACCDAATVGKLWVRNVRLILVSILVIGVQPPSLMPSERWLHRCRLKCPGM